MRGFLRVGPGVENRFCRSEDVLDLAQLSIAQYDGERAQGGIGAQDIEAVIKGVFRHPVVVDLEVFFVRGLEVTSIGAVADQRLVAAAHDLSSKGRRHPRPRILLVPRTRLAQAVGRPEDHLTAAGLKSEWGALLMDLDRVQEIETEQDGKRFLLRTPVTGDVGRAFQAVGIALPPNIREADAAASA